MITIKNFEETDAPILQQLRGKNENTQEIRALIREWAAKDYHGSYFEMFAIVDNGNLVGQISLYAHSNTTVSLGIETYLPYRRNGYAYHGSLLALDYAKKQGFKLATSQVRTDNEASLALHKKLGFEIDHAFVNEKGLQVYSLHKPLV